MQLPEILQGDSLVRLIQGAVAGVFATLAVGFFWGGWVTGGTAQQRTKDAVQSAIVGALAPICVDRFQHHANAAANLVELQKISSWQQSSFIEKGGWATMPGTASPDSAVARACAEMLGRLKT
jgi:hypothetical protein